MRGCASNVWMIGSGDCGARRAPRRSCSKAIRRRFWPCRPLPLRPADKCPRRPAVCRWCALTTTTTRCRCDGRTIRWWSKATGRRCDSMRRDRRWRSTGGWEKEQVRFEPLHYLALLERKPGALDHARPLVGWTLAECFGILRRRLEAQQEGEGTHEYIRVLRLLEKHSLPDLRAAVEKALAVGAMTRDAIAQFLFPREDWRFTVFSLDGHPHLRTVRIAPPDIQSYRELLGGGR